MVRFDGTSDFPLTPTAVWAKLTDARFLAQCIPDVESIKEATADRAVLVLRPGFSFVRGTLDVTLSVVDAIEPAARYRVASKGIGSSADVEATIALVPMEGGTRVSWSADIKTLGGLLKMVPHGLIVGAAQKVVNDAWNAVGTKLAASKPGE